MWDPFIRDSPTQWGNEGSPDRAPKPSEAQSPAEQASGRVSKDRNKEQGISPGTGDLPGCHRAQG